MTLSTGKRQKVGKGKGGKMGGGIEADGDVNKVGNFLLGEH